MAQSFAIIGVFGSAKMRHILKADLLQAMKESFRDLKNLRLLSPNDLEILTLRRNLERQIAALERQLREVRVRDTGQNSDYETAA